MNIDNISPTIMLRYLFIILSMLGYCEFFARKLKVNSCYIPAFVVASLNILVLFFGICGILSIPCYILFYGGLLLFLYNFIYIWIWGQKRFFSVSHFAGIRKEYLIFVGIVFLWIMQIYSRDTEYFQGDHYTAWYHHFLYLVFNDKWSDVNFISFASKYAMISHAFTYFICLLTREYNSFPYLAAGVFMSLAGGFALCRSIRWGKLPFLPAAVLYCLFFEIFISKNGRINYVDYNKTLGTIGQIIGIICIGWMVYMVFRRYSRGQFIDLLKFISVMIIINVMMFSGRIIYAYVIDSILTCFVAALIPLFFDVLPARNKKLYHLLIVATPILTFITLIKPGELMYAILIPVAFLLSFVSSMLIRCFFTPKQQHRAFLKKHSIKICLLLAVVIIPIVGYKLWGVYCDYNNFTIFHNTDSASEVLTKMNQHLKNGLSPEEKAKYQDYLQHFYWSPWMIPGKMGDPLYNMWQQVSKYCDNHLSFGICPETPAQQLGAFALTYFLFVFMLLGLCFCIPVKRLLCFGLTSFFLTLAVVLIYWAQMYFSPFFLRLPLNFRYFVPAFCLFLSMGLYYIFSGLSLAYRKFSWRMIPACLLLLVFVSQFGLKAWGRNEDEYLTPGLAIWTRLNVNSCKTYPIIFASPNPDYNFYKNCLCGNVPAFKEMDVIYYNYQNNKFKSGEKYLLLVGNRINIDMPVKVVGDNGPGVYLVEYKEEDKTLNVIRQFCTVNHLKNWEKKYPLSDIINWNFN